MTKISDIVPGDESLEKESPLLHSISKENPFAVPQNYFDGLPSEIMQKCREEVTSHPKSYSLNLLSFLLIYKWKFIMATSCVAMICFFTIRINNRAVSYEAMAQNIPDSLIIQHLDKEISSINETALEDLQEPENLKSSADSVNTDQDIVAYLIDHNVNVSDIENE